MKVSLEVDNDNMYKIQSQDNRRILCRGICFDRKLGLNCSVNFGEVWRSWFPGGGFAFHCRTAKFGRSTFVLAAERVNEALSLSAIKANRSCKQ